MEEYTNHSHLRNKHVVLNGLPAWKGFQHHFHFLAIRTQYTRKIVIYQETPGVDTCDDLLKNVQVIVCHLMSSLLT